MEDNNILIIDDSSVNLELLFTILDETGYTVRAAISGKDAFKAINRKLPDLILLDIRMSDMDGYEVCKKIKQGRKTNGIPVLFISGLENPADKVKAFEVGGVDYITKPFQPEEVLARVKTHLTIRRMKRNLESIVEQRNSELKRLATAIEQIVEEIIVTNPKGIIEYVNPAFEKISGWSKTDVVGKQQNFLKPYEDIIFETINRGDTWSGHQSAFNKNGEEIIFDVTVSPIYNEYNDYLGYVSVRRDITEQLRVEKLLSHVQKMQAIGTLAGGIAHDFNNILFSIIGYTEFAIDKAKDIPEIHSDLKEVLNSSTRAKELVEQILAFSRHTEIETRVIKVTPIIKEVVKFLKASLPSTVKIVQNIKDKMSTIKADPTQIHQILMNLLTNSAHAMKDKGGEINVLLEKVSPDSDYLKLNPDLQRKEYVRLEISDNGVGIKEENLDLIFDPYFTTKAQGEGTGLGLAVVSGIVKSYNGVINVESYENKGTTFEIFLPICKKTVEKLVVEKIKRSKGNEKILFVDDEEPIASLGKAMLEKLGYKVVCNTNPLDAIKSFENDIKSFDLIITDKTMPEITGFELAEKIRLIRSDIPIILYTGFCEEEDIKKIEQLGINKFIMKPVNIKTLSNAISSVLGSI